MEYTNWHNKKISKQIPLPHYKDESSIIENINFQTKYSNFKKLKENQFNFINVAKDNIKNNKVNKQKLIKNHEKSKNKINNNKDITNEKRDTKLKTLNTKFKKQIDSLTTVTKSLKIRVNFDEIQQQKILKYFMYSVSKDESLIREGK